MDELVHRFNHNFNLYSNELKLPVKISNILNNMTTDVPNLIFHGNDYIYISIVILTFMKNFFSIDKLTMEKYNAWNLSKLPEHSILCHRHPFFIICTLYSPIANDEYMLEHIINLVGNTKSILTYTSKHTFHFFIIENAHFLSNSSQWYLRRTMETVMKNCRFIFSTKYLNNIIAPLHSRSFIINTQNNNFNSAVKSLYYNNIDNFDSIYSRLPWIEYIEKLIHNIFDEDNWNYKLMNENRDLIYSLYSLNSDTSHWVIILFNNIIKRDLPNQMKNNILKICSDIEFKSKLGSKQILYFETIIVDIKKMILNYK